MNTHSTSARKSKPWLLAESRQWHTWGGVIAALFLLVIGTSGVILNYKQPIFTALGLESMSSSPRKPPAMKSKGGSATLSTTSGISSLPVGFDRALQIAREQWGDVRLERIEVKSEHGETHYKIKRAGGDELWVNADTGSYFAKGQYEKIIKGATTASPARQTDWGKVLLDLHTGRIGGVIGKAIMSAAALLLVFLSLSGVYMWLTPLVIHRKNKRVTQASGQISLNA